MSMGVIAAGSLLALAAVGLAVHWYVSRREEQMRADMRRMLAKYVPLDTANAGDGFGREDGSGNVAMGGDDRDTEMAAM